MSNGVKPIPHKDHRTYDFHRTFGAPTQIVVNEFDLDPGFTMPNQNADGYPNGCTGYTQADCATDQDKIVYNPVYTYKMTLMMDDQEVGEPCSVLTSLKSTTVYGLMRKDIVDDPALHRRAPYFIIRRLNGSHFDGIVSAMWTKLVSVSVATPWPPSINNAGPDGIVTITDWPLDFTSGHNYKICGVKKIRGVDYLRVKSWQGENVGDKGWLYFDKATIDRLLAYRGAGAFANVHAEPGDIRVVQMTIMETIISYMRLFIKKIGNAISGR